MTFIIILLADAFVRPSYSFPYPILFAPVSPQLYDTAVESLSYTRVTCKSTYIGR